MCSAFFSNLIRKKPEDQWRQTEGPLLRYLTTFDLTMIGFGSVVGAGIYFITGHLARNVAGPGIVIAFLIAAIAALFSGLCYVEFSSRLPKARAAYTYTYIALGEIWAFVVGWNIILEYFTIAAVLARGSSGTINSLSDGKIFKFFLEIVPSWKVSFLPSYPDFLAVLLVIVFTCIVCLGFKQSSLFVRVTSLINIIVVVFILIAGTYYSVGSQNWSTENKFLPYGWSGVFAASAGAFFCFMGVDQITIVSEEAIDPSRNLARAIEISLLVIFLVYFSISTVLTLMIPYDSLMEFAPIAEAFNTLRFKAGKYIVNVGSLAAIASSLMSAMFGVPRLLSSMAADGLLFKCFAKVHERTKIPIAATLTSGFFVSLLTLFLDINQMVEMLSIGTLTAYSLLAIAVVVSRYDPHVTSVNPSTDCTRVPNGKQNWWSNLCQMCNQCDSDSPRNDGYEKIQSKSLDSPSTLVEKGPNKNSASLRVTPTDSSSLIARVAIACTTTALTGLLVTLLKCWDYLVHGEPWAIIFMCLCALLVVFSFVVLWIQPKNSATFPYMVPCVPLVPVLSIAANLSLIVSLSFWSYVRVVAWLFLGLVIYFTYSYRNSSERGILTEDRMDSMSIIEKKKAKS